MSSSVEGSDFLRKLFLRQVFKDLAEKHPETFGGAVEELDWDEQEVAAAEKAEQELEKRDNGAVCTPHLAQPVAKYVFVHPDEGETFGHDDAKLLGSMVFVEEIRISSWEGEIQLDDKSVELLATLPRLKKLDLSDTSLTDEGFAHLARLTSLESLEIWQPEGDFFGTHFDKLGALKNLKSLKINCSAIDMKKVAELQQALPECVVEIERRYKFTPVDYSEPVESAQDRLQQAIERSVEGKEE